MIESNIPHPDQLIQTKRHTAKFGEKSYDVYKLIAASESLPVQKFNLSDHSVLEDILKGKYWNNADSESIGPSDLLEAFEQNDGMHRLTKAIADGVAQIPMKEFVLELPEAAVAL